MTQKTKYIVAPTPMAFQKYCDFHNLDPREVVCVVSPSDILGRRLSFDQFTILPGAVALHNWREIEQAIRVATSKGAQ